MGKKSQNKNNITQKSDQDEALKDLKDFMLNINVLDKLSKYDNEINFFEITGMESKEIKHSNFLAWLFDANANHGLDDLFARKFMQNVVNNNKDCETFDKNIFKILLLDFHNFKVKREWNNIDIFMVSDIDKVAIAIENKIYASEGKEQTKRYRDVVEKNFADYTKIYVYLTREGEEACDSDFWCCANYHMVRDSIEEILREKTDILPEVKFFLNNYISLLRRKILMDNEIEEVCTEIYRKYGKALDLIYEFKKDEIAEISDFVKNFIENNKGKFNLVFDTKNSNKSYVRFKTECMDKLFPKSSNISFGWKNGESFMYEIVIKQNQDCVCIGTIADSDNENCKKLFKISQNHKKDCGVRQKKGSPKVWATVFRSKVIIEKEDIECGKFVEETLSDNLERLFKEEIPNFEKLVISEMNKN